MLEEVLVLGGRDGLHQDWRNVAELHRAALFAAGPGNVGDELRLELIFRPRGVVLQRDDLRDASVRELDGGGFLIEVRFRAGEDIDGVWPPRVVSRWIGVGLGISAAP